MPTAAESTSVASSLGYLGVLYHFKQRPNTVLKLLGGVGPDGTVSGKGWRKEENMEFATNVDFDIPAPAQPANLEGANAPAATTSQLTQAKNTTSIFHERIDVTYLKQSTPGRFSGVQTAGVTPEENGEAAQIERKLIKIAQDANYTFLRGAYALPADPKAVALKTRGILTSVVTNVFANGNVNRALTKTILNNAFKSMIDNCGVQPDALLALMNTSQLAAISALYETQFNNGQDKMVAGVMVRQVYTPFGIFNLALELDMPQDQILLVNPGVVGGVYNSVKGKPAIFVEDLAKVGSSDSKQIYGQIAVDHGPEWAHGLIDDLTP